MLPLLVHHQDAFLGNGSNLCASFYHRLLDSRLHRGKLKVAQRPEKVTFDQMKRITQILTTMSAAIFATDATGQALEIGATIPLVEQSNQDSKSVKLADLGKAGYLLVYFYPKSDTPGCTKQACSLRDSYVALTEKSVKIIGVSSDKVKSQKAFKEKYKLPFDLLADDDATVIDAFGVPKTIGFAKRQAFLFKDGKLVWKDLSAATDKQAEDVLRIVAGK